MPDRLLRYAAALLTDWYAGRSGRAYALVAEQAGGAGTVFVAESPVGRLALAVAPLWEPEADAAADDARRLMEGRLDAGSVRGPFLLWAPPHAAVPSAEPGASDFVQRVQQAAAPLLPGAVGEVPLPVRVRLAKLRDEGGYASVTGGLARWWTLITERVEGTFHVDSAEMRRAPADAEARERLFDRIRDASRGLRIGEATVIDADEAWTLQRLPAEPLGERGFAIAQAPPRTDPADGTLMRRLVRRRLKEAGAALAEVQAEVKGVGLLAAYDHAEQETVGSFVKSLDPSLFAGVPLLAAIVDGQVRPIFQPR